MAKTDISTNGRAARELDAEQIAALVRESHPVCLLPWRNEGNPAKDDCSLYIYQTQGMDAGLYTRDVLSVIDALVPDIDLFAEQDVERLLFEGAEIRARYDGDALAAVDEGILNNYTGEVVPFSPEYIFTRRSQYEHGEWLYVWRNPRVQSDV